MNDLKILRALRDYFSLYLDQLEEVAETGLKQQALRMHLQRMRKAGYVVITIVPTQGVKHAVYSLTVKGAKHFDNRVARFKQFFSESS